MKGSLYIAGWMIFYPVLLFGSEVVKRDRDLAREYGLMQVAIGLPKIRTIVFYGSDGVRRAFYRCRHKLFDGSDCRQTVPVHRINSHIQQFHSN